MFDKKKKKKFLKATRRQIGDETGFDSFSSHNGAWLFCRPALIVAIVVPIERLSLFVTGGEELEDRRWMKIIWTEMKVV